MLRRIGNFPFRFKNFSLSSSSNFVTRKYSTKPAELKRDRENLNEQRQQSFNFISSTSRPTSRPSISGGRRTFVSSNSAESIYDLFKRLLNNHRNVKSRGLLGKTLLGVLGTNREMEFVDLYFDQWWKQWTNMLDTDPCHSGGRIFIATSILNLGKINLRVNGELGKRFQREIFRFIQSKLISADFSILNKKYA